MRSPIIAVELHQLLAWLCVSAWCGFVAGVVLPQMFLAPGHPAPSRHVVFEDRG
jgi:hypothetical protein